MLDLHTITDLGQIDEGQTYIFFTAGVQKLVSIVFVITFILLIPVMLLPKPIIEQ